MKKYTVSFTRLLLPGILLIFAACTKTGRRLPAEAANLCSIKSIGYTLVEGIRDTLVFTYDRLGRPVSALRNDVGTGSPNFLFRYDSRGNLQDYIGAYANGGAEFWTRYTYSKDNRTVWDTTYSLVSQYTVWPPTNFSAELVATAIKKYDVQGRLIQIFTPYIPPIVFQDSVYIGHYQDYTYDANGDLEDQGATYDDKINFHRTNKVWMLVDDQYSVNNPFPIDAYNGYGLPVKFNSILNNNPYPNYYPILFGLIFGQTVITYDCDVPKKDDASY